MNGEPKAEDMGEVLASLQFPARAEQLKVVRACVQDAAQRCGCSVASVRDIVLAIDEACQNIIRHAYGGIDNGEAILECRRVGDDFVVSLRDFARTVDPASIKPRDLDDLRPGGLGVHFINEVMDDVTYMRPPFGQGNLLRMTKKIG